MRYYIQFTGQNKLFLHILTFSANYFEFNLLEVTVVLVRFEV